MTVPVSLPAILDSADVGSDEALSILQDALTGADDGELFLERSELESLVFDDGRLKTCDYSRDAGFGLRGVSGEMTGFAHANEISEEAIRRAGETLALLDPAKGQPAPPPLGDGRFDASAWDASRSLVPGTPLLFRYSALTFNKILRLRSE